MGTTIPVKKDTKQEYDVLRDGRKHDSFVKELIGIYRRLDSVERAQIMQRSEKPASAGGASTGDGACVGSLVQQLNTAEETL